MRYYVEGIMGKCRSEKVGTRSCIAQIVAEKKKDDVLVALTALVNTL